MKKNALKVRRLFAESLEERALMAVVAGSEGSVFTPEPAAAVTWEVNTTDDPSTWSTTDTVLSLREALARASAGDSVIFASSLRNKTITLTSEKMLTVNKPISISAESIGGITISGNRICSVFEVNGMSMTGTVSMVGLTIINGVNTGFGGGIENREGTLYVRDCVFTGNSSNFGAAIYSHFGNTTIVDSEFYSNTAKIYGAAVNSAYGTLSMTNCAVYMNDAEMGAGIYSDNSTTTITDCEFSDNTCMHCGGAIYVFYGDVTVNAGTIVYNTADEGGGVGINSATITLNNTLISDNVANSDGGGIHNFWGTVTLKNCTVAGNQAGRGGGFYNDGGETTVTALYNTICAVNYSVTGNRDGYLDRESTAKSYYSLSAFTGWASSLAAKTYTNTQPLFVSSDRDDYHLANRSQAVDVGNNSYTNRTVDLEGNPRIINGIVDMGVYEFNNAEPLETPEILTGRNGRLVSYGMNRHRLEWTSAPGASLYEVAYSSNGTNWLSAYTSSTSLVIRGLTYGDNVQYKVRAVGDGSFSADSEWSLVKTFAVCPMDVDGDEFIGPGDSSYLSRSWFAMEGDDNWDYFCDIDGDGFIGPGDRSYLSANWFCVVGLDPLFFPPAAADSVFESADIFDAFL